MKFAPLAASILSLLLHPGNPSSAHASEPHRLVLVGAGRFAMLADLNSIARSGDIVRMRALQVGEDDLEVAGQRYWGGWSWWAFDCAAKMADRLDFASVRDGGAEGPATADEAPAYPASAGGDAAELLDRACDPGPAPATAATSVAEAVQLGRKALADADD